MPSRVTGKKYLTPEVQPPDGYIVLRSLPFGEQEAFSKRVSELVRELDLKNNDDDMGNALIALEKEQTAKEMRELIDSRIVQSLVEWNWVFEDGSEMPLPSKDATILKRLTNEEYNLISTLLQARDTEAAESRKKK